MTARKIVALPDILLQAAPGNVSVRESPKRCSIGRIKTRHCKCLQHQGWFAGAARLTRALNWQTECFKSGLLTQDD
jgi:hypothetical protein